MSFAKDFVAILLILFVLHNIYRKTNYLTLGEQVYIKSNIQIIDFKPKENRIIIYMNGFNSTVECFTKEDFEDKKEYILTKLNKSL